MYLDQSEKERLCTTIYKILKERGGCWITADIYINDRERKHDFKRDDKTEVFYLKHNIEKNQFNSFEEAETFFKGMGFIISKVAEVEPKDLSSMKNFLKTITENELSEIRKAGKIRATWLLKVDDSQSMH
jgi:hypothetical protein